MRKILIFVIILGLFFSLFPINIMSAIDGGIIYEDDFTDSVKPEWETISGYWEHNSTLNAYQTNMTDSNNELNLNYSIPNDNYVEFEIVKVSSDTGWFWLYTRNTWDGDYSNGYTICYNEVYSTYYGIALYLTYTIQNVQKDINPISITWDELEGFSSVTDFEGHRIGISAEGNLIKGYLDGVEILSKTYTNHTNGTTSIDARPKTDGVFIFDNFKVFDTTLSNNSPNKSSCIYPVDKTTHISINTTLRTKVIDIDNDNMNVSFYLDDIFLEKFSNVSNNTIVESSNLSLDYSKIYTWYVVVEDEYNSTTSDIFIFATDCEPEPIIPNTPPEKPILFFPDNNSINISKFTKLKSHVNDIDDDFLYVSFYWENNSEIQSLFSITNYTIQTSTLNLEYNTSYSWYVIVSDFIDYNISDIYTFTTEIEIEIEIIEDEIIEPPITECNYSILFIGICLALIVFILEFLSNKLKIKRTNILSAVELSILLVIIFIMIFLRFT